MAGALAAFFGCPLGGSLFALEVCSRFGVEYFEHLTEALVAGEVCLVVFRSLTGEPVHAIWRITAVPLAVGEPIHVVYGAAFGFLGAAVAWAFRQGHVRVMRAFQRYRLLDDHRRAVLRAWAGAAVFVTLGLLVPQTLFWGEIEIQTIATMAPVSALPHVFPAASVIGFEMHNFATALAVGVAKLVAISFSVAGGCRGGFIFPLFASGAALGRAVYCLCPFIPVQLCVLCTAAAINVAVTRTALATTLILAYLAGEPNAIAAILAASLVSLVCTSSMPFIASQVPRSDLDQCLYRPAAAPSLWTKTDGGDSDSGETVPLTPFSEVHKHSDDDDDKRNGDDDDDDDVPGRAV